MAGSKQHKALRAISAGITIVITIMAYGLVLALQRDTLINPLIPLLVATAITAVTADSARNFWHRLSGYTNRWLLMACHIIVLTGVIMALFYSLNYFLADESSSVATPAVVEKRYSETRHHTRRIGRNRYVQGNPYKVHYAKVRFDSGKEKSVLLPLKEYKQIRVGDTLTFHLQRGLFGVPVLKR